MLKVRKPSRCVTMIGLAAAIIWTPHVSLADSIDTYHIEGTDICVPDKYTIPLPTPSPSEEKFYDVSEGHDISVLIDSAEAHQAISGYKKEITIGGDTRNQGLYLSLYPASNEYLKSREPENLTNVGSASNLYIADYKAITLIPMSVFEKQDGIYRKWGYCMLDSWNNSPMMLECEKENLMVDSLRISYQILETNLHLYKEIDQFVKEKFNQWRCK